MHGRTNLKPQLDVLNTKGKHLLRKTNAKALQPNKVIATRMMIIFIVIESTKKKTNPVELARLEVIQDCDHLAMSIVLFEPAIFPEGDGSEGKRTVNVHRANCIYLYTVYNMEAPLDKS